MNAHQGDTIRFLYDSCFVPQVFLHPCLKIFLLFQGELHLEEGDHFHDRPPLDIVIRKFRAAKITAYIAGLFFTALFVCIWPGSMLSIDMLDLAGFKAWTIISRVWAFIAAAFIITVPLVQEVTWT
jgi:hypothetical protein